MIRAAKIINKSATPREARWVCIARNGVNLIVIPFPPPIRGKRRDLAGKIGPFRFGRDVLQVIVVPGLNPGANEA
jgi:hypothetical protein